MYLIIFWEAESSRVKRPNTDPVKGRDYDELLSGIVGQVENSQ